MKEAHVEDQMDKIKRMAEKKGVELSDDTLKFAMEYQGGKIASPDLIIKSNTRGYKFSSVKPESVDKALAAEAIKGVKALGLQFGAVDCVIDSDGKAWVIEVNTGPGLEGTAFKNYVEAFTETINGILAPKTTKTVAEKTEKKGAPTAPSTKGPIKKISAEKLRMLADMLEEASEDEAAVVNSVAARMFGNG
jgi:hypothetical protein